MTSPCRGTRVSACAHAHGSARVVPSARQFATSASLRISACHSRLDTRLLLLETAALAPFDRQVNGDNQFSVTAVNRGEPNPDEGCRLADTGVARPDEVLVPILRSYGPRSRSEFW